MSFSKIVVPSQVACLLLASIAAGSPCPKPRVKILVEITERSLTMLQNDYGFKTVQGWHDEVAATAEGRLRDSAEGFEAYKGSDCPDFRLVLSLSESDSARYFLSTKLVGMGKAYIIDEVRISEGGDLASSLSESVGRIGDIEELIRAREDAHPWPARDPRFEVTVDPEAISPHEGDDTSKISVRIFHCNGKLVPLQQTVYFVKPSSRGEVNTPHATAGRGANGTVDVKYKLDYSRGTHPGKDIVEIWTHGYCKKRYTTQAVIRIKPREGRLEIEKNLSELGICGFEGRCVVQVPFEMIESESSENYEIKGGESKRPPYKLSCPGCNVITGDFWARITGGRLDMERKPENPLSLSFEIFRDNEVHTIDCRQPPLVMPRGKQQQMSMKLHSWPLVDGHSEQIGVFRYTLHLGRESN